MRLIFIPVFLIIVPVVLGLPWCCALMRSNLRRTLACLPMGYFLEFSVFQLLTFPFSWFHFYFSSLCITYTVVLCICCTVSIVCLARKCRYRFPKIRLTDWEKVYLIIFLIILGYQIYNSLTLDRTYMSYDDATYVAIANDTLVQNTLYSHAPYTGVGSRLIIQRALQSSIIFPSYLSYMSGVDVVVMEHTILDVYYLAMAYLVYAFLGSVLYKRENTIIFLIVIEVIYIFGNYSIYSPAMRLLGLNYPGKAILAVIFFPLLFTLLIVRLNAEYKASFGALLFLLSGAATGLTLFGTVMMIVNVTVTVLLSLLKKPRKWEYIRYIGYASIMPTLYGGIFLLFK